MFNERALGSGAITEIFGNIQNYFKEAPSDRLSDVNFANVAYHFAGEVYMGHLRYSTTGKSDIV